MSKFDRKLQKPKSTIYDGGDPEPEDTFSHLSKSNKRKKLGVVVVSPTK